MQTIIISYFEAQEDETSPPILLGQENFLDIDEAFVPNTHKFADRLFLVKKFSGQDARRWHVVSSELASAEGVTPVQHHVVLKSIKLRHREEWLPETLAKHSTKASTHLRRGVFVEVDYGFHPAVVKASGEVRSNKRYPDSVQAGSMPKRRLAVVVQARANWVQVVPVSSQDPGALQSCFELEPQSLSDMASFTKKCWAIGHMVESVSIHRILPPETIKNTASGRYGRNTNYSSALSARDKAKLEAVLLKGVGQGAYLTYKDQVAEANVTIIENKKKIKALTAQSLALSTNAADLQAELSNKVARIAELEAKLERAAVVEEFALDYAKRLGFDLLRDVAEVLPARTESPCCQ